jgi:hypothetical protein
LARRAPKVTDEPPVRPWTEPSALGFVLLGITYLNLCKNPAAWTKAKSVPAVMLGLSAAMWFGLAYVALAAAFLVLVLAHRRRPLPLLPTTWWGRGQLLYLVFLWWIVLGNFERALVSFAPMRLVTEGVIHLNAVLCTVGVILGSRSSPVSEQSTAPAAVSWAGLLPKVIGSGLVAMALSVCIDWGIVRGIYGNRFAGHANLHIRFGPNATATKEKPSQVNPHP